MEKQKLQPGPKPRIKRAALQPPGDFIALGKSSAVKPRQNIESDASKPIQPNIRKPTLGSANTASGQKRKESSPVNPVAAKQSRTFSPSFPSRKDKSFDSSQILPVVKLVDAQATELEELVLAALQKEDQEQLDGLICAAIKTLKLNRLKPDPMIYLTFMTLAKTHPVVFSSKKVTEHLLQFLRRENSMSAVKPKPNTLLSIMTCNILLHVYRDEDVWPHSFMKVFVEDALGDRSWVDNENNKDFVANISKVFGTVLPQKPIAAASTKTSQETSVIQMETSSSAPTTLVGSKGEEERIMADLGISLEAEETILIRNRYATQKDELATQNYISDVVKEQLNKRQMIDSVSRNMLRFLTSVCGYVEVRLLASQKIETWLQNPKLTRPTQELLMSVVLNCNTHSDYDVEVISNLVKMRLKAKPLSNHYVNCMRELLNQHPDNLGTTMKRVIYNELSQQRNPNNMAVLSVMFSNFPDSSAKYLSAVFQELLCNREDYLRAIRALFREIVRSLKYEINLAEFCRGLMQDRREQAFHDLEQIYKDRMLASIIDLITLACFLSVSPTVKELASAVLKNEKRDFTPLHTFQNQIASIQRDSIWFFHTKVKYVYNFNEKDFLVGLNRILFLESSEFYSQRDNWPPESERNNLMQLVTEVPLLEDSLFRLHLLGLSPDLPLNCAEALDIIEKVVLRSAVLSSGLPGLVVERSDILKMLLTLAGYNHPKEIALPVGYDPPILAIKLLYWKAWLILLILTATNPSTIGIRVWEQYPTARCMMEMVITGCYEFPPFSISGMSKEDIRGNELQISRAEKDKVLVFEGHLAAATNGSVITESSSLLISQLIDLDPTGPARQPPPNVMEQLKIMNDKFKLGKLLCQCREPDFLLLIIESQGSSKSMPWLADLVQSSESSLSALPLQCLCEFLLMKHQTTLNHSQHYNQHKHKSIKSKVAGRLQDLLCGSEATQESASNLVQYFINRWWSTELKDREASVHAFETIIVHQKKHKGGSTQSSDSEMEVDKVKLTNDPYAWLHEKMMTYPFIGDVLSEILIAIVKALKVEMNAARLQAYLVFLSKHCNGQDMQVLTLVVENLCHLIMKRRTVINAVLKKEDENNTNVKNFYKSVLYLLSVYMKSKEEEPSRKDDSDYVHWTSGEISGRSMNISQTFIRTCLVTLTYGDLLDEEDSHYQYLQGCWLALSTYVLPNNQTDIVDDDLRLSMLQSGIEGLVCEAMKDINVLQALTAYKVSGLPSHVRTIILAKLNEFAESEPKVILNSTPNKHQLINLVTTSNDQTPGRTFLKILYEAIEKEKEENENNEDVIKPRSPVVSIFEKTNQKSDIRQYKRIEVDFSADQIKSTLKDMFSDRTTDQRSYQQLKQQLSRENIVVKRIGMKSTAFLVIESFLTLCQSDQKFTQMFCESKNSCVLIRILSLSSEKGTENFRRLITHLRDVPDLASDIKTTLKHLCHLHGIIDKKSSSVTQDVNGWVRNLLKEDEILGIDKLTGFLEVLTNTECEKLDVEDLIKIGVKIYTNDKSMLESFLKRLCRSSKNRRGDRMCVDVLIGLMKRLRGNDVSGLIVDWLCLLDPEILELNPVLLREFLFTTGSEDSKIDDKEEYSTAPYLASVLTHEARNCTLQDCVHWMLASTRLLDRFNASGCLDFLNTMLNNPRLFQGRDNKQHQHDLADSNPFNGDTSPLLLSMQQTYHLIQIILTELSTALSKNENKENEEKNSKDITFLMEKRLNLLLSLCRNDENLQKAVNMCRNLKNFTDEVLTCFLQYFYMKKPTLCNLASELCNHGNPSSIHLPKENRMEMDLIIHRLIVSISEPDGSQAWNDKFKSISSLHRRLAVQHPFAFVRQLPLLLSLMKGKDRLTASNFKWTNQLTLCNHVFDLFDLLRPHVFTINKNSKELVSEFVDVFLELIYAPCLPNDDVAKFVGKLSSFLTHYASHNIVDAGILLKKHENTFRELLYDFPNFHQLTCLVAFMRSFDEKALSQSTAIPCGNIPWSDVQLRTFRKRLSTNHHEHDLQEALRDVRESTKHDLSILSNFTDELSALVFFVNEEIRDGAHELLLSFYRYQPRKSKDLIELYKKCMNSNNADVIKTTAKFAPQGLLLSHGRQLNLLGILHSFP